MPFYDDSSQPWVSPNRNGVGGTMRFGSTIVASMLPSLSTLRLDLCNNLDSFNPSIIDDGGDLLVSIRVRGRDGKTVNELGKISGGKLVSHRRMSDARIAKSRLGYEDCRLFRFDGKLRAAATWSGEKKIMPEMVLLEVDVNGDFAAANPQRSIRAEKNWGPVVDMHAGAPRLRFVYTIAPLVVLTYSNITESVSPSPESNLEQGGLLRGGSRLIPYGDGWLSVIHEVSGTGRHVDSVYTHRFAKFDLDLTCVAIGRPFYLQRRGIEFVAGLAQVGASFFISYGVEDKWAFVAEIADSTIEEFLTD
jgi:predicted GH43/DUF377 family glycosyl hydrolase